MATRSDNNKQFRCSFCNKTQDQVRKLVAGPKGVYICDECIEVCTEIMEDEFEDYNEDNQEINLMKPMEMKAFLEEQKDIPVEYDEQLVRRLVEKVTVFDEKIAVKFKSGVEIEVDR